MAKQRFGLGRGLDALISGASDVVASQTPSSMTANSSEPLSPPLIDIDRIIPNPRQPRRVFHEDDPRLLELSASIQEHGLIQPIVVTRLSEPKVVKESKGSASGWFDDQASGSETPSSTEESGPAPEFQIVAGERRWRAARKAGLKQVPVVIKEVSTPQELLELALIENIQRADLNPIEEALAYQTLVTDFGLTQEAVAKQVGKDRSTIANSLRLLKLAPQVREALMNQLENFTEGHARALVEIKQEADQVKAMQQIIALRLNVRQAEELASRIKASENVEQAVQSVINPSTSNQPISEINSLEHHFRDALMVKVDLKYNHKGKGTLVLHFNNQEELEGLYNRIVKQEDK